MTSNDSFIPLSNIRHFLGLQWETTGRPSSELVVELPIQPYTNNDPDVTNMPSVPNFANDATTPVNISEYDNDKAIDSSYSIAHDTNPALIEYHPNESILSRNTVLQKPGVSLRPHPPLKDYTLNKEHLEGTHFSGYIFCGRIPCTIKDTGQSVNLTHGVIIWATARRVSLPEDIWLQNLPQSDGHQLSSDEVNETITCLNDGFEELRQMSGSCQSQVQPLPSEVRLSGLSREFIRLVVNNYNEEVCPNGAITLTDNPAVRHQNEREGIYAWTQANAKRIYPRCLITFENSSGNISTCAAQMTAVVRVTARPEVFGSSTR